MRSVIYSVFFSLVLSIAHAENLLYGLLMSPDCSFDHPQRFWPSGKCIPSTYLDPSREGSIQIVCDLPTGILQLANCSSSCAECRSPTSILADDSCYEEGDWPRASYSCQFLNLTGETYWRDVFSSDESCGSPDQVRVRLVETESSLNDCKTPAESIPCPSFRAYCQDDVLLWDTFNTTTCTSPYLSHARLDTTCLSGTTFPSTMERYGGCGKPCNGLSEDDPHVCSGRGICQDGECECYGGEYYGPRCSLWNCFNVSSSNETVCGHGNGICEAPDNCLCMQQFLPPDCVYPVLFDINSEHNMYLIVSSIVVTAALVPAIILCCAGVLGVCFATFCCQNPKLLLRRHGSGFGEKDWMVQEDEVAPLLGEEEGGMDDEVIEIIV